MEISIKPTLNKAQLEAVQTLDGPVLVVAGAGTGKTRVLEYRTLELIKNGADPKSILLLTFTRRAANEMLLRASRHNIRCKEVAGGTFHSFALFCLQKYGKLLSIPPFTVLDRADMEEVAGKVISQLRLRDKNYFPKKNTVADIISKSANKLVNIKEVIMEDYPHLTEWVKALELVGMTVRKYKEGRNLMDFDDLLSYFSYFLEKNAEFRLKLAGAYTFIMVDEYQDTNKLQAKIVKLLGQEYKNILVVGDEMQSIYRFRGAEYDNIIEFPVLFDNTKTIKLEENYRSTQSILNVANAIIDEVEGAVFKKYLHSTRSGKTPEFYQFKSPQEEAEWVGKEILKRHSDGIDLKQIAVLFRASYQSAPLEIVLSSLGIPFKKFGGIRFAETAHIKDMLAHLRVLDNPYDELSWRRIIILVEGIGEKSADTILNKGSHTLLTADSTRSIPDWVRNEGLRVLYHLLLKLKNETVKPQEKIQLIYEYYRPLLRSKFDDYPQREQDIDALIELSGNYKSDSSLLSDFAIDPPEHSAREFREDTQDDWVTLSTVHSAKGLEWKTVFVIQAQEGKFPIVRVNTKAEDIEEERRLFYVAVTRPKDELFISASHGRIRMYDSWYMTPISRFVDPLLTKGVVVSKRKVIFELPSIGRKKSLSEMSLSELRPFGLPEKDVDEF
jgi:DNA helicase-2/ATP-dependent DNA helicase PcrA